MHSLSINWEFKSVLPVTSRAVLPSLFILSSSVCKARQCLVSTLTQGDEGGHLFRLTCSVVLWGWRDIGNKHCWHMCGVLTVDGSHLVCHRSRWHVLPGSTLLKLQGALQEHCPKWSLCFMHFPGLSCSGSWVLYKGTEPMGCAFSAFPRSKLFRALVFWWMNCPRWAINLIHHPSLGRLV